VFGAYDKKAGSFGSIADFNSIPYNHKPQVVGGFMEAECSQMLTDFFKNLRTQKTKSTE
jgi:tRNA(adenine34) deaminase